jgi:hypothetical protein
MAKHTPIGAEMTAMQGGNYATSIWFTIIVSFIESRFPGAAKIINAAAAILPWDKVNAAIMTALADWQDGKDFNTILQDVLSQWVTITKGKMTAKSPA